MKLPKRVLESSRTEVSQKLASQSGDLMKEGINMIGCKTKNGLAVSSQTPLGGDKTQLRPYLPQWLLIPLLAWVLLIAARSTPATGQPPVGQLGFEMQARLEPEAIAPHNAYEPVGLQANSRLESKAIAPLNPNELPRVQAQSPSPCLQAAKPICAPTPDETSEFFSGNISIKIILPDNINPKSTESWTPEELQQIMEGFGLRAIKRSGQTFSQLEKASKEIQQAGSSVGLVGEVLQFWFTNFNTSIGPPGTWTVVSTQTEIIEQSLSQTIIRGNMILQRGCCEFRIYRFQIDLEGEEVEGDFGEFEFIKYTHDCGIGSPAANFDLNACGLHAPPIGGPTETSVDAGPSRIWINAVMNAVDPKYSDTQENFVKQVRKYANDIRERKGADWAIVVFIVDASNDEDGMFAQSVSVGPAIAWSQVGGPFMVLSNRLGGYGFDNFDKIFLHEFLHQFYALDEYSGSFDEDDVSGYLGIQNLNHEDTSGGPFTGAPSIMKRPYLVLNQSDFIVDRIPACPGHWTTDPFCEVEFRGKKTGAIMNTKTPPCQAARGLTRGCFEVDWHNDQNYTDEPPPFWFMSVTVDPQGPFKPNETYRIGRYYLVNPLGTNPPIGRAVMEAYTDSGALIGSRDLHRTIQLDKGGNPIFEFQSMEFTIPQGATHVDIYFARCFAAPGEECFIVAYDDFVIIGDWVFRSEIDEFAAKMLGFRDSDGDGLIDPVDTTPEVRLDPQFIQRITLRVDAPLDPANGCELTVGGTPYFFQFWRADQDARVVDTRGLCGEVVDIDFNGPSPVITAFLETDSPPSPCTPKPPSGNPIALLINASDGRNLICDVPVVVIPPDVNSVSGGTTPFTLQYSPLAYTIGTPISGYAFDVPLENRNPFGSHNSVTVNKIQKVQYSVDATNVWFNATAADGVFDGYFNSIRSSGEDFTFIPSLTPGIHTISVRSINSVDNVSSIVRLVVNASGPPRCAKLEMSKSTYSVGEIVNFNFHNGCTQTIDLRNTDPWVINNSQGNADFQPSAFDVITPVSPGGTEYWTWDQKSQAGNQVPPGIHAVELETMNAGIYATSFEICHDLLAPPGVGIEDIQAVAGRWHLTTWNPDPDNNPSTPNYEPVYDVDYSRITNILDVMTFVAHWGVTCP